MLAEEVSGVVGDGRGGIGVDGFFLFFAIASSRDLPTDVSFLVCLVMAKATGGWPVIFTNGAALPPVLVGRSGAQDCLRHKPLPWRRCQMPAGVFTRVRRRPTVPFSGSLVVVVAEAGEAQCAWERRKGSF